MSDTGIWLSNFKPFCNYLADIIIIMTELTVKNLNLAIIIPKLTQSFNFTVPAGQCLGISGPSGIGKSVLLKAIADMLPHKGEIYLGDLESQSVPAPQWRKKVALLPAESQWWFERVGEHFSHFDEALFSYFGFKQEVMNWQIAHISSGEKQRLACIRVLMNQPQALLLDEPTANLDKQNRDLLEQLIRNYQCKHQIPTLWISHDQEQLQKVSDLLLVLAEGSYEITPSITTSVTTKAALEADPEGVPT